MTGCRENRLVTGSSKGSQNVLLLEIKRSRDSLRRISIGMRPRRGRNVREILRRFKG